ncbi:hypothetical protein PMAYCL1PPCAC_33087, partial [Pristionchus mayeri]
CPLAWTFQTDVAKAVGGQSLTMMSAQNRINSDVELAVIKAVESYGYSSAGVSVVNAVTADGPITIDKTGVCPAAFAGVYVQRNGVVEYECLKQGTADKLTDPTV